jgi:DNA-binding NarL/FixJ family response regulator
MLNFFVVYKGICRCAGILLRVMNIFLIDEHTLFREGMRNLLPPLAEAVSLTMFDVCEQALELPTGTPAPDLILKDWHRGASSFATLKSVCQRFPLSPVVVVSGESGPELIRRIIAHGAAGFIPKQSTPHALIRALHQILNGEAFMPETAYAGYVSRMGHAGHQLRMLEMATVWPALTQRQLEVFHGALRGLANKEIARELAISDGTVQQHLSTIYRVLGVASRTEAVSIAARRGIRTD